MNQLDQPNSDNDQDLIILTDLLTDYLPHLAIGQVFLLNGRSSGFTTAIRAAGF